MSNSSDCGSLDALFPTRPPAPTPSLETDAAATLLQATPTAATLCFLLLFAACPPRRSSTAAWKTLTFAASGVVLAAQGVLAWRVFELLDCDDELSGGWAVASAGGVGVGAVVAFAVAPRAPVAAILLFWLAAAGTVALDWCFRGGLILTRASHPLVAVQHTYATLSVLAVTHLRARRASAQVRGSARRPDRRVSVADTLHRKEHETACAPPARWSWFAEP